MVEVGEGLAWMAPASACTAALAARLPEGMHTPQTAAKAANEHADGAEPSGRATLTARRPPPRPACACTAHALCLRWAPAAALPLAPDR